MDYNSQHIVGIYQVDVSSTQLLASTWKVGCVDVSASKAHREVGKFATAVTR